jgi:hypothetical protein
MNNVSSQAISTPRKRKSANNYKLPAETEKALLTTLLNKTDRKLPFKATCDERPNIFGAKASELRLKVQKRRTYLLSNPTAFADSAYKLLGANSLADFPELTEQLTPSSPPPNKSEFDRRPTPSRSSLFPEPTTTTTWKLPAHPPSSSALSNNKMPGGTSDHHEEERSYNSSNIQTYHLNFMKPWQDPCHGMIAIKGLQWEDPVTKQVVDKLSIYKPIYDINDYKEGRYQARLSQSGDAIIVTEPVVAEYLWNEATGGNSIQNLVDGANLCQVTDKSYKITRTRFMENKEYRTFETRYLFPPGVTCNNEFFNGTPGTHLKLVTKMVLQKRLLGQDGNNLPIYSFMPFVVWKMAIDGDDSRTSAKKQEDPDSFLSDALSSLGINLGTNNNNPP